MSFVSIGASADHAAIAAASCARLQDRKTRVTEPNACPCGSERRDRVSGALQGESRSRRVACLWCHRTLSLRRSRRSIGASSIWTQQPRSEEHTSELQSLRHLVCRLL